MLCLKIKVVEDAKEFLTKVDAMMKPSLLIAVALLLAACVQASGPGEAPSRAVTQPSETAGEGFSGLLNNFRASQGEGTVVRVASLDRAALAHARDMAARGFFSHDSPGGPNGDTFVERARAGGCFMLAGAENIADGQQSEAEVIEAWKGSPGHRRNMLVSDYTQFGLGQSGGKWVLLLARSC